MPSKSRERYEEFTDHALLALCDLQLVTGTAILVSGFGQWSTISFYHRAIVSTLAYLTLGSFWASRASAYRTVEFDKTSFWQKAHWTMRQVCIMIALVLLATFVAFQTQSEQQDWDLLQSGKCYRCHDSSSTTSSWLWVAGLSLYALTLCLHSMTLLWSKRGGKMEAFHPCPTGLPQRMGRIMLGNGRRNSRLLHSFSDIQSDEACSCYP